MKPEEENQMDQELNELPHEEETPIQEGAEDPIEEPTEEPTAESSEETLEELKAYKERNVKANREILEAMTSYPELRGLIADVVKGAPLTVAIARNIDVEDLKPVEGEPDYDEWTKSATDRANQAKSMQEAASRYDGNIKSSVEGFEKFCTAKNLDDEQRGKMLESIKKIFDDISDGLMGEETLEMIHKSLNFEKIIEEVKEATANDVGNKRITEFRQSKEHKQTDGIPKLSDSGMTDNAVPKKDDLDNIIQAGKPRFV